MREYIQEIMFAAEKSAKFVMMYIRDMELRQHRVLGDFFSFTKSTAAAAEAAAAATATEPASY